MQNKIPTLHGRYKLLIYTVKHFNNCVCFFCVFFSNHELYCYQWFYSTYCSSGQPAGQWHKHPTRFHRSRDTSSRSRAPSRATTTISTFRINDHNMYNEHNPTWSVYVHDYSGVTFPLSMHKSSVCITSELQQPHKRLLRGSKRVNTHLMVLVKTRKSLSHLSITSAMNWLAACACCPGGPGRKREEHRGGRSTLGTKPGWTEYCSQCLSIY